LFSDEALALVFKMTNEGLVSIATGAGRSPDTPVRFSSSTEPKNASALTALAFTVIERNVLTRIGLIPTNVQSLPGKINVMEGSCGNGIRRVVYFDVSLPTNKKPL